MIRLLKFIGIISCLVFLFSCGTTITFRLPSIKHKKHKTYDNRITPHKKFAGTKFIKYSIQVGAFHSFTNAESFSIKLNQYVEAFCFKDKDDFFKVRFGNFSSKESARKRAEQLRYKNIIDTYFLVMPEQYVNEDSKPSEIRHRLISEAASYIGVAYRWGGEDPATGFDCSGLTFSVYRKSGIMLPRTSIQQYKTGKFVLKKNLKKGDLVFFKTRGKTISHVGIYTGNSQFIHAPGRGKTVCYESLYSAYYKRHYGGARTYL
jgi:cell wall-associated NlpC family hydrolase